MPFRGFANPIERYIIVETESILVLNTKPDLKKKNCEPACHLHNIMEGERISISLNVFLCDLLNDAAPWFCIILYIMRAHTIILSMENIL